MKKTLTALVAGALCFACSVKQGDPKGELGPNDRQAYRGLVESNQKTESKPKTESKQQAKPKPKPPKLCRDVYEGATIPDINTRHWSYQKHLLKLSGRVTRAHSRNNTFSESRGELRSELFLKMTSERESLSAYFGSTIHEMYGNYFSPAQIDLMRNVGIIETLVDGEEITVYGKLLKHANKDSIPYLDLHRIVVGREGYGLQNPAECKW